MDKQTIADELARLAGWKWEQSPDEATGVWISPKGLGYRQHEFPVGSIDALEAFRRERLPGWVVLRMLLVDMDLSTRHRRIEMVPDPWKGQRAVTGVGSDEWTARASALIAAAKENKP